MFLNTLFAPLLLQLTCLVALYAESETHPFVDAGSSRPVWFNHPTIALKADLQGLSENSQINWSIRAQHNNDFCSYIPMVRAQNVTRLM